MTRLGGRVSSLSALVKSTLGEHPVSTTIACGRIARSDSVSPRSSAIASDTPAVRALCTRYHAHLHIDAAFAAFAPLDPAFAHYGPHLALADSVTSDAHKWLNVPYDCGLFFSRKMPIVGAQGEAGEASLFALTGPGANAPAYLASAAAAKTRTATAREPEFPLAEASKALPSPLFMNIENSRRL